MSLHSDLRQIETYILDMIQELGRDYIAFSVEQDCELDENFIDTSVVIKIYDKRLKNKDYADAYLEATKPLGAVRAAGDVDQLILRYKNEGIVINYTGDLEETIDILDTREDSFRMTLDLNDRIFREARLV